MKLSEVKVILKTIDKLYFKLPNGSFVPAHFHVTEIGKINKNFVDCGGTIRNEEVINFQLWNANDYDHRLHPEKLLNIIEISEKHLLLEDNEIEVEYQGETISKYHLEFDGVHFVLINRYTDCLAKDSCGIYEKPKMKLSELSVKKQCEPNSGCC